MLTALAMPRSTDVPTAHTTMVIVLYPIDHIHQSLAHLHLLGVHAVLGQILHIYLAEIAQTAVNSQESLMYTL